ncbi:OmpP1/FadL family transporter [Sphingomonas immobilis]|uniref:Porin n=1 Tax=Sphingomonas immobilis TaxID=3063997 RepID=A0ABT9A1T4_9SPHN|nr:porin [Sphingomonas sp. CA1-15]MDO7843795.1 porin [Sphingomonas sp. CA1-15]
MKKIIAAGALPLMALGLAGTAHASGFYLQEQSVRGNGRAFSGETADQGAASMWWNPAAIGGIRGCDGALGVSAILPRGNVNNLGTVIVRPGQAPAAVGGDAVSRNPITNGVLPSGGFACAITPRLSVGMNIGAPYAFETKYPTTSWARYTALQTKLRLYDLQPTIAFAVTPEISIGAGLNVHYAEATLSNALPQISPLLPGDGFQELKGNGWDVGYSVGAQYHKGPLQLGVGYKSAVKHTLTGTVTTSGLLGPLAAQNSTISTTANFSTPWQVNFGARYRVSPQVTLNAQAVRMGWSEFDAIRLGAPLNAAIPENYRDTWSFAGGVDYDISPKLTLRAGVQHDQTPTSNGNRDARVPDNNRWNFSGGASYNLSERFTIDAAATYIAIDDAVINRTTAAYAGTAAQTPILVNGSLTDAHAVVLSIGGRVHF